MSGCEPDMVLAAFAEQTLGPTLVSRARRDAWREHETEQRARAEEEAIADALNRIATPRAVREEGR